MKMGLNCYQIPFSYQINLLNLCLVHILLIVQFPAGLQKAYIVTGIL